jgi:hypothetical protein
MHGALADEDSVEEYKDTDDGVLNEASEMILEENSTELLEEASVTVVVEEVQSVLLVQG